MWLVCCCVYTSYSAVLCVCVCVYTGVCVHMYSHACDVTGVNSSPFKPSTVSSAGDPAHTLRTHTHSARHQPPSPQSCHANHLNSTIKANKMFHVGRKSRGKWLSVFVNVTELKGTLILIVSPVSGDSWFSQQSCKKITAATNKSLKREREKPL